MTEHTAPTVRSARWRSFTGLLLALPLAALLLGVVACLPVPVGDPETSKADPALVGAWLATGVDGDKKELYIVRAFDKRTYFVHRLEFRDEIAGIQPESSWVLKGWHATFGGEKFICLDILNTKEHLGIGATEEKMYIVGTVKVDGNVCTLNLTNPQSQLVSSIRTQEQAEAVLKEHAKNPSLYTGQPYTLKRLGDADKEFLRRVVEAFKLE